MHCVFAANLKSESRYCEFIYNTFQHRMLRLVSKRVKKVTRRRKAGRSQRIDMVNPLWGNTAAAGTQESSDEGTEIETQGKSAEVKEKTFVLKSVRDAHAPGEEP